MQNLTYLISKEDVHRGCSELLRSPVMIESYKNRGFVFSIIDQYASLPRILFDYSDHALERAQFNSYYGTLSRRQYESPAISDLYNLHEMGHGNVANYQHGQSESLWIKRMTAEEAYVSVMTELVVYFELPELRSQVHFPGGVIWADGFLDNSVKIYEGKVDRMMRRNPDLGSNPSNQALFEKDRELFISFAIERRENIMHSANPESLDPQERAIHGYGANNFAWSDIWRSVRTRVEDAMLILQDSSKINRGMALANHQAFLDREQGNDTFPFAQQAREFKVVMDAFYAKNSMNHIDTKK